MSNNDLISREALKKAMNKEALNLSNGGRIFIENINKIIDNAPTVPMRGQELGCDICVNHNIKSKEACTSPFGECKFFNCGAKMKGGAE